MKQRNPGTKPSEPQVADIQAIRAMPKDQWFTIGDVPIEGQYKALIYLLEEQPRHKGYTLVSTDHYLHFMWRKNPS